MSYDALYVAMYSANPSIHPNAQRTATFLLAMLMAMVRVNFADALACLLRYSSQPIRPARCLQGIGQAVSEGTSESDVSESDPDTPKRRPGTMFESSVPSGYTSVTI